MKNLSVTLTGTGTSAGIPMIGCTCRVCTSSDPRDRRDRCGAIIRYHDAHDQSRTVLIDTPPELRHQMVRHHIMQIDAIVYTHNHADHVFGFDDLRRFNAVQKQPLPVYAESYVTDWFARTFTYVFESHRNPNPSFIPQLLLHPIDPQLPVEIAGASWQPIRLMHGRLPVLGYRIGNLAYCTDCSRIGPESYRLLENLEILVLDALRYRHHPTHLTVDQALHIIDELQPRRAYLTHIAHDIEHADLESRLPEHVFLAYDGLTLACAD